jgi:hypothetical protein
VLIAVLAPDAPAADAPVEASVAQQLEQDDTPPPVLAGTA